ncbi:FAD-dependent oxidoreductase [bacterium]|nr:FAD-dependent oxidoreductase [bacterium]
MKTLAIIGTGIAGMGCAHFLHKEYDLTVYEQENYIGGHTNTVTVDENGKPIYIDTGFMVYNDVTYPNLIRLFSELGVKEKNTSMSFSVQHVPTGLEYSGSGLNGLFAQRKNLFNIGFIKMLTSINRFNKECVEVLTENKYSTYTLEEYVAEKQFDKDFLYKYIIPMSSAVWSTPPAKMARFPVAALVRFFHNHGFLGLNTQHQWKTLVDGSRSYRDKLIAPFRDRIFTKRAAVKIVKESGKAAVTDAQGNKAIYDSVILACHGDQALRLLERPTDLESRLLKEFRYQKNIATLHTDVSFMPSTKRAWSSWNYRLDSDTSGSLTPSTIYYMNSLQHVSDKRDYFVSINGAENIDPGKILKQIDYEHPLFSVGAVEAQKELPKLNADGPVYFCGSYFRYGFHEDAFTSALELSRRLSGKEIWS